MYLARPDQGVVLVWVAEPICGVNSVRVASVLASYLPRQIRQPAASSRVHAIRLLKSISWTGHFQLCGLVYVSFYCKLYHLSQSGACCARSVTYLPFIERFWVAGNLLHQSKTCPQRHSRSHSTDSIWVQLVCQPQIISVRGLIYRTLKPRLSVATGGPMLYIFELSQGKYYPISFLLGMKKCAKQCAKSIYTSRIYIGITENLVKPKLCFSPLPKHTYSYTHLFMTL